MTVINVKDKLTTPPKRKNTRPKNSQGGKPNTGVPGSGGKPGNKGGGKPVPGGKGGGGGGKGGVKKGNITIKGGKGDDTIIVKKVIRGRGKGKGGGGGAGGGAGGDSGMPPEGEPDTGTTGMTRAQGKAYAKGNEGIGNYRYG
jgi:hypothetical protein